MSKPRGIDVGDMESFFAEVFADSAQYVGLKWDGVSPVEMDDRGLRGDERMSAWSPLVARAVDSAVLDCCAMASAVESPLEEVFLVGLWNLSGWGTGGIEVWKDGKRLAERFDRNDADCNRAFRVECQARVGQYCTDFLLTLRQGDAQACVAVEVDGHAFHEKTKRQVEHDKKRDRAFAAIGLTKLRFSGSEVHRDVEACLNETMRILSDRMSAEVVRIYPQGQNAKPPLARESKKGGE